MHAHAVGLAALRDVGDEVLAAQRDALLRRRRRDLDAASSSARASRKIHGCSMARRPTITPAQPVSSSARFASSRAADVAVDDAPGCATTSRARAAHVQSAAPEWPICAVRQWIVSAATPASSRRRARSTMGMCDSGPRPMRVFTVTGSDTLEHDQLRHRDHRRRIAQPARAGAAAGDLRHPAAAVDVDERRARRSRRSARPRRGARDRSRRSGSPSSSSSAASCDLAPRVPAAAEQALDVDELGHAEVGAELAAEPAEDGVGHVLHRREDDGLLRVERAEAIVRGGHRGPVV